MFKLIALDVDGTLLDSHHALTPGTTAAIAAARQQGVQVVLATGRQYVAIQDLVAQLRLTAPQITSHGALVTDPTTGQPIYQRGIPYELGRKVLSIGQELGVTMIVVGQGKTFALAHNRDTEYMLTYGDPVPHILPDLTQALDLPPTHLSALAYQQDALYDEAYRRFSTTLGGQLNVTKSSPYYIEFLHPLASKGQALRQVCDDLGIERQSVLAVGDSFNDLSMFEFAGFSVAMGHSPQGVKQHAQHIAPTNDEDGVAQIIHEFVLR